MSKSGEQRCHPGASVLTFSELRNKFTSMPLSAILYYFVSFSSSLFIHGLPFTVQRPVTPIFARHFLTTTPVCHSHSRLRTILSTRLAELVLFKFTCTKTFISWRENIWKSQTQGFENVIRRLRYFKHVRCWRHLIASLFITRES